MVDIKIKDIRVLPGSLDLKNNAGKSLSEILGQLQSGSIVKGLVVGTTPRGEVIFHTAHGRFAAKNDINLVRGDTISLKLAHENKDLSGTIVSVNDKKRDNIEPVKLSLPPTTENTKSTLSTDKTSSAVSFSNNSNIPKSINGEISYLNLSKIDKNTPLFRVLNSITTPKDSKIGISLNIVSNKQVSNTAFTISGEVSGNAKDGSQLIKTAFGVILSKNTNMLVGQKLNLEISSVNNQSLANATSRSVNDFLFSANKNWPLLKSLVQTVQGSGGTTGTQSATITSNSSVAQQNNPANSIISNVATDTLSIKTLQTQQSSTVSSSNVDTRTPIPNLSANISRTDTQAIGKSPNISIPSGEQIAAKTLAQETFIGTKELIANAEKLQTIVPRNIKSRNRSDSTSKEDIQSPRRFRTEQKNNNQIQTTQDKEKASINSIIKNLGQTEEIRKLSSELMNLKELILPSIREGENPEKWQTILIPFYNGRNVEDHEVKIQRSREYFLRFIVDVNLLDNPMQIDGLIRFENDNITPKNFDLTVRAKNTLEPHIRSHIAEIYQLNQNLSGVRGTLAIEQQDF